MAREEFEKEMFEAISSLLVFQGVELSCVEKVVRLGEYSRHKRGEAILSQGDPIDYLYVIVSGRVLLESHVLKAFVGREDVIGGMALVGVENCYFTATVQHDAVLFKVPIGPLREITAVDTVFLVNVLKRSATHLNAAHLRQRRESTTLVAVYSAPAGVGKTRLAANLAAALVKESTGRTLVVDVALEKKRLIDFFSFGGAVPLVELKEVEYRGENIVEEKGKKHEAGFEVLRVSHRPEDVEQGESISPLLSNLTNNFQNIIIDLPPVMDSTIWKFLENADTVIIVSSAEEAHLEQTENLIRKLPGPAKVVITHGTLGVRRRRTELEKRIGHKIEVVLEDIPEEKKIAYTEKPNTTYSRDLRRFVRILSGKAWGLALSSGAARGTSHVGVLRVLEEEGLIPDAITGTSIGALLGAMWSMGRSAHSMERLARRVKRKDFFPLSDLSFPPSPSLYRGAKITEFVERVFGDKTFSDLTIPLQIAATDIDTGELIILDSGRLSDAIRASIAIPGLLRPVELQGRRLVDGAVISPVPVSPLTRMGISRIVAVNVIPPPQYHSETDEMKKRRFIGSKGLLGKLFDYGPDEIPNIIDIIGRTNLFMGSLIADELCSEASIVIRPWLPEIHWIDFDASPRFVEAGARAAQSSIAEIRGLIEEGDVKL